MSLSPLLLFFSFVSLIRFYCNVTYLSILFSFFMHMHYFRACFFVLFLHIFFIFRIHYWLFIYFSFILSLYRSVTFCTTSKEHSFVSLHFECEILLFIFNTRLIQTNVLQNFLPFQVCVKVKLRKLPNNIRRRFYYVIKYNRNYCCLNLSDDSGV